MRVIDIRESLEPCEEAGWAAYDMILDTGMDQETIGRLGDLGALTYLGMLKQPFYRVEQAHYMIRGLEGAKHLRVSMLRGEEEIMDEIKRLFSEEEG